jgi:hypothetical protein
MILETLDLAMAKAWLDRFAEQHNTDVSGWRIEPAGDRVRILEIPNWDTAWHLADFLGRNYELNSQIYDARGHGFELVIFPK